MASRIALALGVLLAAVWIASAWLGFVYWGRPGAWSGIGWGNAYFCCERTSDPESWRSGWALTDQRGFDWSLYFEWMDSSLYYVHVPLWIPALVLFLLAGSRGGRTMGPGAGSRVACAPSVDTTATGSGRSDPARNAARRLPTWGDLYTLNPGRASRLVAFFLRW